VGKGVGDGVTVLAAVLVPPEEQALTNNMTSSKALNNGTDNRDAANDLCNPLLLFII
jgi:hypothetical protein